MITDLISLPYTDCSVDIQFTSTANSDFFFLKFLSVSSEWSMDRFLISISHGFSNMSCSGGYAGDCSVAWYDWNVLPETIVSNEIKAGVSEVLFFANTPILGCLGRNTDEPEIWHGKSLP